MLCDAVCGATCVVPRVGPKLGSHFPASRMVVVGSWGGGALGRCCSEDTNLQ